MSILGVDLGTAFARAAVATDRGPVLLQFSDGSHAVPAVVAYQKGAVAVGRAAVAKAAMRPESTVRGVKRLLGRAAGDPLLVSIARYASFGIESEGGVPPTLVVDGERRRPEEVAAAILEHLAVAAREITGMTPTGVVLAVPYYFGPRQRLALTEAARLAGLPTRQIVSEGTAIALSVSEAEPEQRRVAIVDVGAGGLTVSISETGPGRVLLLGTAGDPAGGGDDLDRGLLGSVLKGLKAKHGEIPDQPAVNEMLRQACEEMKLELGVVDRVRRALPFLPIGPRGLRGEEISVDQAQLAALLGDTVARVEAACQSALAQADLGNLQISAVYATGGLANLPAVRAAIERTLGRITARKLDPDGAVALGAALTGGMMNGDVQAIPIIDVHSKSMPPPAMPRSLPPPPPTGQSSPPPPLRSSLPPPLRSTVPPRQPSSAPPPLRAPTPPAGRSSVRPAQSPSTPPAARPSSPPPQTQVRIDPDALALEVAALLASVRAGAVTDGGPPPQRRLFRVNDQIDEDDLATPEDRAEMARRLQSIWKHLGLAMQAMRQYRWDHPQATRYLDGAMKEIREALELAPRSVRFDIGSAYFAYQRTPIWRPDRPPFDHVPYQLFADGLRRVQWKPGLGVDELRGFLSVLLTAASGFAADADAVSALWERRFTRIAHAAVDAFVEADDPMFEAQRDALVEELAQLSSLDAELEGRLGSLLSTQREAADQATAIAVPEETRRELAAGAELGLPVYVARQLEAFPDAYFEAERYGDLELLTDALEASAADRLLAGDVDGIVGTLDGLRAAMEPRAGEAAIMIERELAVAMLPRPRCDELLARLGEVTVTPVTARELARVLNLVGDASLRDAAEKAYWAGNEGAREALLPYLLRAGEGREEALGKLARSADIEHGIAALARLAEVGTAAARAALHQGFMSPHIEVRVAAITHLPDASAETVRAELTKLFEDPAPEVRGKALGIVGRLRAVAAGPVLVRRIQSEELASLPIGERRLLLGTLGHLNPRRAEAVAIDLLGKTQLVPTHASEETRVVAAELLGEASSPEALQALQGAVKKRWWNSAPVRAAAEAAMHAVAARLGVTVGETS